MSYADALIIDKDAAPELPVVTATAEEDSSWPTLQRVQNGFPMSGGPGLGTFHEAVGGKEGSQVSRESGESGSGAGREHAREEGSRDSGAGRGSAREEGSRDSGESGPGAGRESAREEGSRDSGESGLGSGREYARDKEESRDSGESAREEGSRDSGESGLGSGRESARDKEESRDSGESGPGAGRESAREDGSRDSGESGLGSGRESARDKEESRNSGESGPGAGRESEVLRGGGGTDLRAVVFMQSNDALSVQQVRDIINKADVIDKNKISSIPAFQPKLGKYICIRAMTIHL